jgi:predicted ATP-dependent endonuclease of OLD family
MDLNWLKIKGYKRLESATLNTSARVLAIVGPNEAGKSSILKALMHLNNNVGFSAQEMTRGIELDNGDVVLEAGFLLDDSDRESTSHLYQGDTVRQLIIRKYVDGRREYEIIPILQREQSQRLQLIDCLRVAIDNSIDRKKKKGEMVFMNSLLALTLEEFKQAEDILPDLENTNSAIEQSTLTKIKALKSSLDSNNSENEESQIIANLKNAIVSLIAHEQEPEPNQQAEEILIPRVPKTLFFDNNQRSLASQYELSKHAQSPPPALLNLAALANLDLVGLLDAISKGDQARVQTLLNKANMQIEKTVQGKWSQSGVKVSLTTNASVLSVLIEDEQLDCTNLEDRSDGLRQFIALINFLESEQADKQSILLIDEAEIHLHYDAQADLMNMFAKQQLASKIIYTTHSAGCLPEDLGTGVRFVSPNKNEEKSTIENWFWRKNRPGFSHLLFGMGASNLAFVPIRKAVFVEGPTDMLLLPTMFLQVTSESYLGFQIAPGLSTAARTDLSLLENEAPVVAFLVDNDHAGKKIAEELESAGINKTKIFQLPGKNGLVLEDFVCKELYLEAVNKALQDWQQTQLTMPLDNLPNINRPAAVEKWCTAQGIETPDKRVIAYNLLDFATGVRQEVLVHSDFIKPLKELYERIAISLKL